MGLKQVFAVGPCGGLDQAVAAGIGGQRLEAYTLVHCPGSNTCLH